MSAYESRSFFGGAGSLRSLAAFLHLGLNQLPHHPPHLVVVPSLPRFVGEPVEGGVPDVLGCGHAFSFRRCVGGPVERLSDPQRHVAQHDVEATLSHGPKRIPGPVYTAGCGALARSVGRCRTHKLTGVIRVCFPSRSGGGDTPIGMDQGDDASDSQKGRMMLKQDRSEASPTATDVLRWEAEFQMWLASAISRRLETDGPPHQTPLAQDARRSAENLASDARVRLRDLGAPVLAAVPL